MTTRSRKAPARKPPRRRQEAVAATDAGSGIAMNLVLDRELHEKLRVRAREDERTMAGEIRAALRAWLNGDGS